MWNLKKQIRDAYHRLRKKAASGRMNWHGVIAVLAVCALCWWWFKKDWPAEESRIGVKPEKAAVNTAAVVRGADTQVQHSAPEIEKIEAAAKKVEAAAQQIEATAVALKAMSFSPRRTTRYTDSQARLQMKYGWYLFFASFVYALLVIFSAEKTRGKRLANHRVAFGAHLFILLAFGALRLDGPARQTDDFYAFSFLASLAIGMVIPHLLAWNIRELEPMGTPDRALAAQGGQQDTA